MILKKSIFIITLSLTIIFIVQSCQLFDFDFKFDNLFPQLKIDKVTQETEQNIPVLGGEIIINSGSDIDGFKIVVPANSYSIPKPFKISTASIKNHKLGDYFNPISPLILIENGGGYADSIMELTIPITLPENHIPIGLYYDDVNGTLEGIPIKSYNTSSITLLTRHFNPASSLSTSDENLKGQGFIEKASNIVISSISEEVLRELSIISSGFKPGDDDWEFTNYGSYIAPGGHCAGQNMAAMWYYYEKKLNGEANLNGRFSTVQSIDYDNAIGYRFCSVIHEDLGWNGAIVDFFYKYIDKEQKYDLTKFLTIAYAMLLTGEPQGVGIYDGSGGHDLICYSVDIKSEKLLISDPNSPGKEQFIKLKDDRFEPYIAKKNANTTSSPYPYITYYAKTSLIEWNKIGQRYMELVDSTIGSIPPNTFPEYNIWALEKNVDSDITNADKISFVIDSDTLRLVVECSEAQRYYDKQGKHLISFYVFDDSGNVISIEEKEWKKYVLLKPGWNKLGVYIVGWKTGYKFSNGDEIPLFIDFKWINVYQSKLEIVPNPISGKINELINLSAEFDDNLPDNVRYEWNFGDGARGETVINDNTISYYYQIEGSYIVSVELYNNDNDALIASTTAEATIKNIIAEGPFVGLLVIFDSDKLSFKRKLKYDLEWNYLDDQEHEFRFYSGLWTPGILGSGSFNKNVYTATLDNLYPTYETLDGTITISFNENRDSINIEIIQNITRVDNQGESFCKISCNNIPFLCEGTEVNAEGLYEKIYAFYFAKGSSLSGINIEYSYENREIITGDLFDKGEYLGHGTFSDNDRFSVYLYYKQPTDLGW